jgi:hypothetical protein
MHDELPFAQALRRDAVAHRVLAQARHVRLARQHPLALHAQDVDDVSGCDVADLVRHRHPGHLDLARDQGGRSDQRHVRAAGDEQREVRACHARVQDVADDRDMHTLHAPERRSHRVQVEQALGRVLMRAVSGVDHRGARVARGKCCRPDLRVADHDDIRAVGVERQQRVLERLALLHGRPAGLERDRVGRKPLGGELE